MFIGIGYIKPADTNKKALWIGLARSQTVFDLEQWQREETWTEVRGRGEVQIFGQWSFVTSSTPPHPLIPWISLCVQLTLQGKSLYLVHNIVLFIPL
jgi:hypothetical protein